MAVLKFFRRIDYFILVVDCHYCSIAAFVSFRSDVCRRGVTEGGRCGEDIFDLLVLICCWNWYLVSFVLFVRSVENSKYESVDRNYEMNWDEIKSL